MTKKQIPKYRAVDGKARSIAQPSNVGNAVRYAGKSNELHALMQRLLCHQFSFSSRAGRTSHAHYHYPKRGSDSCHCNTEFVETVIHLFFLLLE